MANHRKQRAEGAPRLSRRETLKGLSALAIAAAGCSSESSSDAPQGGTSAGGGSGGQPPVPSAGSSGSNAAVATSGTGGGSAGSAGSAGGAAASAGGAPVAGASGGAAGTAGQAGSTAAGAGGAAGAAGQNPIDALQCIVTPAMTEGPFFVDEVLDRSDLVMGESADAIVKAVPLHLVIGVFDVQGMSCAPKAGVQVDLWHADALGVYSDVAPGVVQSVDTRGKKFLRGSQITDAQGLVAFDTIYPGWYMSRTIHIHFKLRMPGSQSAASEFTSQMFFDEAVNSVVLAKAPYSAHPGMRSVLNGDDHIYNGTARNGQKPPAGMQPPGKVIMPLLEPMGTGYVATLKLGVQA